MKELFVSIEKNGELIPAGRITGRGSFDAQFTYSEAYIEGGRD